MVQKQQKSLKQIQVEFPIWMKFDKTIPQKRHPLTMVKNTGPDDLTTLKFPVVFGFQTREKKRRRCFKKHGGLLEVIFKDNEELFGELFRIFLQTYRHDLSWLASKIRPYFCVLNLKLLSTNNSWKTAHFFSSK